MHERHSPEKPATLRMCECSNLKVESGALLTEFEPRTIEKAKVEHISLSCMEMNSLLDIV